MYYELYVDVLFLVNFMMDYLLLLLVRKMLRCESSHWTICMGAVLGSFLTCLVIVLPVPYGVLKFIMFHGIVNTGMILVGLKIKDIRSFAKAWILLYVGGFLLGGVMQAFGQYVKIGSLFFFIAVGAYYVVSGIWSFIVCMQRVEQYRCNVELYMGDERCQIQGLIDTGNSLQDPVTDEPVNILDRATARQFFGSQKAERIRYIPYHTIGKQEGILPIIRIDKMCVKGEKTQWIQAPVIGISEEKLSAEGEYQMILNPNIF